MVTVRCATTHSAQWDASSAVTLGARTLRTGHLRELTCSVHYSSVENTGGKSPNCLLPRSSMVVLCLQRACSHLVTCTLTRTCSIVYLELLMKMQEMRGYKERSLQQNPHFSSQNLLERSRRNSTARKASGKYRLSCTVPLHGA